MPTLDELQAERARLIATKAPIALDAMEIERQLAVARAGVHCGDGYADPAWFRRAIDALAHKRKQLKAIHIRLQALEAELGALKREKSQAESKRVERCFIDLARRRLDNHTFGGLMADAIKLAGEEMP